MADEFDQFLRRPTPAALPPPVPSGDEFDQYRRPGLVSLTAPAPGPAPTPAPAPIPYFPEDLQARQHYREQFRQEPPAGYPHQMAGAPGLEELSGAMLGTNLLARPLATILGTGSGLGSEAMAHEFGFGPGGQAVAGLIGGLAGGSLPTLARSGGIIPFLIHPGRSLSQAFLDALRESAPETAAPRASIPPVRFGTRFSPPAPEGPAPIPPVKFGTRFSPIEPLPEAPAPIPPVRFGTRFSPPPAPTAPRPVPPPVRFGTRFSPTGEPAAPEPPPVPPPQPPEGGITVEPLPPLDKVEMNRMLHAKVQRMNLPGSPAGQKAPGFLSTKAMQIYNKSWDDLTIDEMKDLYNRLDSFAVQK